MVLPIFLCRPVHPEPYHHFHPRIQGISCSLFDRISIDKKEYILAESIGLCNKFVRTTSDEINACYMIDYFLKIESNNLESLVFLSKYLYTCI